MKDLKSKMLNSTYSNACDPNSMRDQGKTRNAQYTYQVPLTSSLQVKPVKAYHRYLDDKRPLQNPTLYTFGGTK